VLPVQAPSLSAGLELRHDVAFATKSGAACARPYWEKDEFSLKIATSGKATPACKVLVFG
jgi:hypothetical protein